MRDRPPINSKPPSKTAKPPPNPNHHKKPVRIFVTARHRRGIGCRNGKCHHRSPPAAKDCHPGRWPARPLCKGRETTPSPLLLCLLRSSLPFVRWRRRPIHPAAGRIPPDQTRPETPSSCHPVNYTIACSLPGMGLQGRSSREIALASDLVCFPGIAEMRDNRIAYHVCMTITRGQCRAEYTSSLSAPGTQIVFFSVSLYRFLRPHCSLQPSPSRGFRFFG